MQDGILTGEGGMGHIYTDATCTDFEAKGMFRISGTNSNSGFYFRANQPADNPDAFPRGYEAQICNSQDAYTGWLWKPGKPTGNSDSYQKVTRVGKLVIPRVCESGWTRVRIPSPPPWHLF
ncbi:MAG: DUF1080 domain-containing protein [Caldiserica bacterium]|nr:DUF1080 domain-containing protein [Caldisericota bacterium]